MGCGCKGRGLALRRAVRDVARGRFAAAQRSLGLVSRSAVNDAKRLAARARLKATARR